MAGEGPGREAHVATLLRTARERAGVTQRGLAESSGVNRNTIIKAEDGETLPTFDVLIRLGAELDIPYLVMFTSHARDALRDSPGGLRQFEEELAENLVYGRALADLYGFCAEEAFFTTEVGADGSVDIEYRYQGGAATRELQSLAFRLRVPGSPERVSGSFSIEQAPADMRFIQEATIEGGERVNRVSFSEPWKPNGPKLTLVQRFSVRGGYHVDRDAYEKERSRLLPTEKWPGKFRMHIQHALKLVHIKVALPVPAVFGPPLAHWDKHPLDETAQHRLEAGRLCTGFEFVEEGPRVGVLTVERPLPGFTFGIRWVPDDSGENE